MNIQTTIEKPLLIEAIEGCNKRVPVWFMRQAGRYLPEYQEYKKKYSLNDMFNTPELAAEITCLPVKQIGVDAAILFADILTLPKAMGAKLSFDNQKGPIVEKINQSNQLHDIDDHPQISRTIKLIRQNLDEHIALIGFAGSPFTVLTYLIEGGSSHNFFQTLRLMHDNKDEYFLLMEKLTQNTITYLNIQKHSGIQLFQLFDTWAGILRTDEYETMVLPFIQKIFDQVDLPSIYFVRNTINLLPILGKVNVDILSVDHTLCINHPKLLEYEQGVQGNLYNGLLYAKDTVLIEEVKNILNQSLDQNKFIFNLNHGVFPDVDPNKLKLIVETVHQFNSQI